jgi:hypothetical protein
MAELWEDRPTNSFYWFAALAFSCALLFLGGLALDFTGHAVAGAVAAGAAGLMIFLMGRSRRSRSAKVIGAIALLCGLARLALYAFWWRPQ